MNQSMYQPIASYGIIGNMHTAALVSTGASIDWFCFPRFDSPSVFAALLDDRKGGRFCIAPAHDGFRAQQIYWPGTNVLITRFLSEESAGEVIDFMPMGSLARQPLEEARPLVRMVRATRGTTVFRLECEPAFNYARDKHETAIVPEGAIFRGPRLTLALSSKQALKQHGAGVVAEFALTPGETAAFILRGVEPEEREIRPVSAARAVSLMEQTADYWRQWIGKCAYQGRWRELVHRSALVLELLAYEPTGAIVAAPTTSLPERIGGERNWDYSCSWIRDSAFTVYALLRIGLTDEATRFMGWIESRCRDLGADGALQTVYGIDGRSELKEETLDHLDGYRSSRPVRIGNAAAEQLQLDIYGELIDSIYLYNKYVSPISWEMWGYIRRMIERVEKLYAEPDNGIWEVRGGKQQFVYSKLMSWVALDRALRLADKRSFPSDRGRWLSVRDKIYEEILAKGWSEKRKAFTQAYGNDTLDASVMMMPMVLFASPTDPRILSTLQAIGRPPDHGGLYSDGSLLRYNPSETDDGLKGGEGAFNMCSFWYVETLTRAGRRDPKRLEQAVLLFEKAIRQANHLGLFSEETARSGEALGNFPQAFTHLGLISAAFNLNRALSGDF
ncbi:MAG: glycoside hydrolase family 15 protein [Terriglobia bacterium]